MKAWWRQLFCWHFYEDVEGTKHLIRCRRCGHMSHNVLPR